MQRKRAVVLLSGGLDSTVLLAQTKFEDFSVHALSVFYGQRHERELVAAKAVANHFVVPHEIISVPDNILRSEGSSQTGEVAVPHGSYDEESMKATVVPNRNMFLISIAVARAIAIGASEVRYAAHAGDHAIYPDCREDFVGKMAEAISLCDWNPPRLVAPYLKVTKSDIVLRGKQLRVPFELTWTCYEGGNIACGRCGTCVERLEAFSMAASSDPLPYKDSSFWRTVVK